MFDVSHTNKADGWHYNQLPDRTVETITKLFCRDDISWQSPNRKDAIIIKQDGEKEYVHWFLMITLKVLIEEHPERK